MQSLTFPIGRIALIPSIAASLLSASAFADECHDEEECVKVYSCHPGHDGVLEGGPILIPRSEAAPGFQPGDWNVETLQSTGPSSNRLDLVLVCDGYTTANIAMTKVTASGSRFVLQRALFRSQRKWPPLMMLVITLTIA